MVWVAGIAANATIWLAYLLISFTVFRALVRTHQLRSNALGLATALIFLTCAGGHGAHLMHLLAPSVGIGGTSGIASRAAYDGHLLVVDLMTAGIGVWYWRLRSHYRALLEGPALFQDLRAVRGQALEINDAIVQGLTVAKYAFDVGDEEEGRAALDSTLASARALVSDLLARSSAGRIGPGDLVRSHPAVVAVPSKLGIAPGEG